MGKKTKTEQFSFKKIDKILKKGKIVFFFWIFSRDINIKGFFFLDLGRIEVDADAAAEGGTGEGGGELGADGAGATVGLGDATPDGAGVAAADGSLGATDTALLLVAVVDEAGALAGVEFGVGGVVDVVDAEDGGVLALVVETAAEGGEGRLHEEAGAGAAAGNLLLLGLEDLNGAGASDVALGEVGGSLNAALRLLDGSHFVLFFCFFER